MIGGCFSFGQFSIIFFFLLDDGKRLGKRRQFLISCKFGIFRRFNIDFKMLRCDYKTFRIKFNRQIKRKLCSGWRNITLGFPPMLVFLVCFCRLLPTTAPGEENKTIKI